MYRSKVFFNNVLIILLFTFFYNDSTSQVVLSGGASAGKAFSMEYEENGNSFTGDGNVFSIFGELLLKEKYLGRLQYTKVLSVSDNTEFASQFNTAYSFIGSLGMLFGSESSRLRFSVMGSAGLAYLDYKAFGTDYGMQIGITAGPRYQLTDNITLLIDGRYMRGIEVDSSSLFHMADLSIGAIISLR